jgi:amino acid transporter
LADEVKVELFLRKATGLVREIGPGGAFIIPWASMAGSGITFYAVQVLYSYPQGSVPLVFLIVGIPTILNTIIISYLCVATPRSAGGYVWATRFVDPVFGWFGAGWIYWIAYALAIALLSGVMTAVLAPILSVMGAATGITALTSFGSLLSTNQTVVAALTFLFIVVVGLVSALEMKHFMRVLIALWAINTVGLIVSAVLFATNSPATIGPHWDAVWGSGAYNAIMSLADKYNSAGYASSHSSGFWGDTLGIVAYMFWALTGYESLGYVAGEVRNPRSSFIKWFNAGMISTVLWYALVTWLTYNAYGDFIFKYNFVYNLYNSGALTAAESASVSKFMFTPSMPLFSASLGSGPVVQVLASLWLWPIGASLLSYLPANRAIFGMSFDRMLPETLGKVSDRTHGPVNAAIFNIVFGLVWAGISFTSLGYLVTAANLSFFFALAYFLYSLAAIALPYKRPEVYEKGVKTTIFGMPAISLIGALSAGGMLWILALSTIGISLLAWNVTTIWMLAGFLVFVYYVHRNKKRGINVMDIYNQIPPP